MLENLPIEVILNIIHYLSFKDVIRCTQISKTWNIIFSYDIVWRDLTMRDFKTFHPIQIYRAFHDQSLFNLSQNKPKNIYQDRYSPFTQNKSNNTSQASDTSRDWYYPLTQWFTGNVPLKQKSYNPVRFNGMDPFSGNVGSSGLSYSSLDAAFPNYDPKK